MDKSTLQRGYKEAAKKLDEQQVEGVKSLVLAAQEVLLRKQAEHRALTKQIQLLKKDLDDVKNGRIEQITERHEKDVTANDVSPINPQMLERAMKGEVIPSLPKTTEKEIVTHIHHHWYNYWGWTCVPQVISITTPVQVPMWINGDNCYISTNTTYGLSNFTMFDSSGAACVPISNTFTNVTWDSSGGASATTLINGSSVSQAVNGTYLLSTGDVKYL